MCGISGLLAWGGRFGPGPLDGEPLARKAVSRMVAALRHRGPDDEGVESVDAPGVTLVFGHTRLSILDLSPTGHQPMADQVTGSRITFNGEIYNFRALRSRLDESAEPWRSTSDTEVLLRDLRRNGIDALSGLRGMFAFGFWDAPNRRLLLARDRFGIKPLYLVRGEGFMAFASELRALVASGLAQLDVDPLGLWAYLGYQSVHAPGTILRGVEAVQPGHWMSFEADGRANDSAFFEPLDVLTEDGADGPNREEARAEVGRLLRESVGLHLVSDVPVATFLSGGIDSSILVALQREMGLTPRTFTVTFPGQPEDESRFAREVARSFGAEHTEIALSEAEILEQVPEALAAMDQPSADGVNSYIISRAVRRAGIKVALSGLGADELFGGYPSFRRLARFGPALKLTSGLPLPLRHAAARVAALWGRKGEKVASLFASDGSFASAFSSSRQVFTPGRRREILPRSLRTALGSPLEPYDRLLSDPRLLAAGPFTRTSFAELSTYMTDVLLRDTDALSMAHGLEVRVPFLDSVLAGYVLSLPDSAKLPGDVPKGLLVEAAGGALPEAVWNRPKQGFVLPMERWLGGPLRALGECRAPLLDSEMSGSEPWACRFALIAFERWHESLADSARVHPEI